MQVNLEPQKVKIVLFFQNPQKGAESGFFASTALRP